jgi:hypothetical protein
MTEINIGKEREIYTIAELLGSRSKRYLADMDKNFLSG